MFCSGDSDHWSFPDHDIGAGPPVGIFGLLAVLFVVLVLLTLLFVYYATSQRGCRSPNRNAGEGPLAVHGYGLWESQPVEPEEPGREETSWAPH